MEEGKGSLKKESQVKKQQKKEDNKPKGYLLLHNISKRNNVGNIIRSACAFGLQKILFITNRPESKKMKILKEFNMFGNQGTYKQIEYEPYNSLEECKEQLTKQGIKVCGVQIGEGSFPIQSHPFTGSTAFFLGNQGTGLLPVHKKLCDYFVYIPQYTEKTASLNVAVAAGIIFHHFALWAGYQEAVVYGQKFQLQEQQNKKQKLEQVQKQKQREQNDGQNIKKQQMPQVESKQLHFVEAQIEYIQISNGSTPIKCKRVESYESSFENNVVEYEKVDQREVSHQNDDEQNLQNAVIQQDPKVAIQRYKNFNIDNMGQKIQR